MPHPPHLVGLGHKPWDMYLKWVRTSKIHSQVPTKQREQWGGAKFVWSFCWAGGQEGLNTGADVPTLLETGCGLRETTSKHLEGTLVGHPVFWDYHGISGLNKVPLLPLIIPSTSTLCLQEEIQHPCLSSLRKYLIPQPKCIYMAPTAHCLLPNKYSFDSW